MARLTPSFFMPTTAALQGKLDAPKLPLDTACDRVYIVGIALGIWGKRLWLVLARDFLLGCNIQHMERLGYSFFRYTAFSDSWIIGLCRPDISKYNFIS